MIDRTNMVFTYGGHRLQHVELFTPRIVMIEPCAERAPTQLAPIFMRNDVVGIVGPRAVVTKVQSGAPSANLLTRTRYRPSGIVRLD
jgi:hypothetical protein